QVPGLLREALAELLDLPAHRLRVVAPDVGGGFGVKSALYPEEVAVCALARLAGRPAKWVGDRREDLLTSTQAWDETIEAELAVHADGTISALRARVVADVGAYSIHPWTASIEVIQVISFLPGPYRVPHYRGEGWGVATNKAPMGPYRGVGRPVSTFVTEALMDRAARRLGIDPVELRLRNLLRPDELPYRSPSGVVWDSGSFVESLERARDVAEYERVRAEQRRGRDAGRYVVIGGGAAMLAARALREKALAIAAHLLEVAAGDLTLADGRATVRGAPDRTLTLREIARAAYAGAKRLPKGMEPGLEATRFYDPY